MPTYDHDHGSISITYGVHREYVASLRLRRTIIHRWIAVKWSDLADFRRFVWQQEIEYDGCEMLSVPTTYGYATDRDRPRPYGENALPATTIRGLAGMGAALIAYYRRTSTDRAEKLAAAFVEYPPALAETAAAAEYLAGVR